MEKFCPRCKLPYEGIHECEYCGLKFPEKYNKTQFYSAPDLNNENIKERTSSSNESLTIWSTIISICIGLGFYYYFIVWEPQPEPPTKQGIEQAAEFDIYMKWLDCMVDCGDDFERENEICGNYEDSSAKLWNDCVDDMLRSKKQCDRQCRKKYPQIPSRKTERKTIWDADATDEEFEADLEKRRERVNKVLKEFDRIWEESTGEKWDPDNF